MRLAAAGEGRVVVVVRGVDTETLARERLPERALVRAGIAVGIRLDPRIAGGEEGRVAGLERERVEEEVHVHDVARGGGRVRARGRGEAMRADEGGVDVVEKVGPDLADVVHLVERLDRRVAERVGGRRGRVGVVADAGGVVDDVLAHDEVGDRRGGLGEPAIAQIWSVELSK